MATTKHRIIATRSGSYRGVDYEEEWEIAFKYTPAQPLRFYKRNGDPADPPDPECIEFDAVLGNVDAPDMYRDVAENLLNDWAADWLSEHEDEAREKALSDLDADQ